MKSRKEAYLKALENELMAQQLYALLARTYKADDSMNIFQQLLVMEKRHEEQIQELFSEEFPQDVLKPHFKPLAKTATKEDLRDAEAALKFAIKQENAAAATYEFLAKEARSQEVKSLFIEFAADEDNHKKMLEDEISRLSGTMVWFDESELNGIMEY